MAPVQLIDPQEYNISSAADPVAYNITSYNVTSSDIDSCIADPNCTVFDPATSTLTSYNATSSDVDLCMSDPNCTLVDPSDSPTDLDGHWKALHAWMPIGIIAGLAFLFLLSILHLWHRLHKTRRELDYARARIEELEDDQHDAARPIVITGSGAGSPAGGPAAMTEKASGNPVVMVSPAPNGNGQEVVVTTTSSGGPGSTTTGQGLTTSGPGAYGGQTLTAPGSSSSPVTGTTGGSTMDASQGPLTATGTQSADPRAAGSQTTVIEQPQTTTETPGMVVREAPRT